MFIRKESILVPWERASRRWHVYFSSVQHVPNHQDCACSTSESWWHPRRRSAWVFLSGPYGWTPETTGAWKTYAELPFLLCGAVKSQSHGQVWQSEGSSRDSGVWGHACPTIVSRPAITGGHLPLSCGTMTGRLLNRCPNLWIKRSCWPRTCFAQSLRRHSRQPWSWLAFAAAYPQQLLQVSSMPQILELPVKLRLGWMMTIRTMKAWGQFGPHEIFKNPP